MNKTAKKASKGFSVFKKTARILLLPATFFFSAKIFASIWDTATDADTLAQEETIEGPVFFSGMFDLETK